METMASVYSSDPAQKQALTEIRRLQERLEQIKKRHPHATTERLAVELYMLDVVAL
jgi:hypothetical protein